MNLFEEALSKAGVKSTDFEDVKVDVKAIDSDMEIEFYTRLIKMCERNASEKELHLFATEHGFLSYKHLSLYMSVSDDAQCKREELEYYHENKDSKAFKAQVRKVEEVEKYARAIKDPLYYRFVMGQLGQRDVSPYGENVLRSRKHSWLDD